MDLAIGIIALILLLYLIFEYRIKHPDEIVLVEKGEKLTARKSKFYPRHFSQTILDKSHSLVITCDADAKGNLSVIVKIAVTVGASLDHLRELIRVGGWETNAVANTSKELEIMLQGYVKSFSEKHEIEELKSEGMTTHIKTELTKDINRLGLTLIALSLQSIEPSDNSIAEAMKQKESARILEENEKETQKVRITAAKLKLEADEKIAKVEHDLTIKKYELLKIEEEREAELANARIAEEIKRKKLQLEVDKEELALLQKNPELLLLSPQAARLAEASQGLKNAKTVVNLSKDNADQGFQILGLFQSFLQNVLNKTK